MKAWHAVCGGRRSLALSLFLCLSTFTPLRAQESLPWWNDAVFYEVFVRSFFDSNGDGIGDFKGLTRKLDYLHDGTLAGGAGLGVKALWLMPIFPSPSYHGYDVTDFRNVNGQYGTLQDFRAFIDSAHVRGIRIIIDFVMNHSSSEHPWFTQSASGAGSPYRAWYTWSNTDPGYRGPWGEQVWYQRNGAYYLAIFWSGMPDLNLANATTKDAMFDAARFWLDSMRVDGLRLDAVKHLMEDGPVMQNVPATFTFLREFRRFYKEVNPEAMTVGEAWSPTYEVVPYVDGTGVDLCFEFQTASAILQGVKNLQPATIASQVDTLLRSYPPLQYATFLTNHDMDRAASQLSGDAARLKLAAAVYLTLPGVPFLYYGEEIGMTGAGADENKRTPMQWTGGVNAGFTSGSPWRAVNADAATRNVAAMQADSNSLWRWYRALISARNRYPSLRRGDYAVVQSTSSNCLTYARRTTGEVSLVLHNFQQATLTDPLLVLDSSGVAPGEQNAVDGLTGRSVGTVTLNQRGGLSNWRPKVSIPPLGTALLVISGSPASAVRGLEGARVPGAYLLRQNYPNPFNPSTTIRYELPERAHVRLEVFNLLGQKVASLVDAPQGAGSHAVVFQASGLPSGVYFCRFRAGSAVLTRTMLFMQ